MDIEAALRKHESTLLHLPNVTSIGLGETGGKPVIIVFVNQRAAVSHAQPGGFIPESVDGFPVEIRTALKIG